MSGCAGHRRYIAGRGRSVAWPVGRGAAQARQVRGAPSACDPLAPPGWARRGESREPAARLPFAVRSHRPGAPGPSADSGDHGLRQAGASVTCPAEAADGRVTIRRFWTWQDSAGLNGTWSKTRVALARHTPGLRTPHGRNADFTRREMESPQASGHSDESGWAHCKNRRLSLRWFEPNTCHSKPQVRPMAVGQWWARSWSLEPAFPHPRTSNLSGWRPRVQLCPAGSSCGTDA